MSYVAVVFVIGLLIAIHEYGHLVAAKWCRIPVARFSVGFGPTLVEYERGGTTYSLSMIPIGGYVLPALDHDGFRALTASQRVAFALGGPMANLVAAFFGLCALGLLQFDLSLVGATAFAATQVWAGLQHQLVGLAAVMGHVDQLSGIVGIVAVGGEQYGSSVTSLLAFSVVINLSLAVLNLLPLPPLDGGRILFCLLETMYRPVVRVETPLLLAGWAAILALMVYVTVQDVSRLLV